MLTQLSPLPATWENHVHAGEKQRMLKDSTKSKPDHQLKLVIQISSPASLHFFFFSSTWHQSCSQRHQFKEVLKTFNPLCSQFSPRTLLWGCWGTAPLKCRSPGEPSGEDHWQVWKVTSNVINSLVDFNGLIVGILTHRSTFSKGWQSCKANCCAGEEQQGRCSPQPHRLLQNHWSSHSHSKASLGTYGSYSSRATRTLHKQLQKCLIYGQSLNTKGWFQDTEYCLSAKQYLALFAEIIV